MVAYADDLHRFDRICATGDDGFFLAVVFDPDLAVETFAIPAEIGVRDSVHIQILQAAEDGVVFRDAVLFAQDVDLDESFVGREDFGVRLHQR